VKLIRLYQTDGIYSGSTPGVLIGESPGELMVKNKKEGF
jgi:hypothetical protein